jgi:lipopolysaccharide export system permease protein
MKILDRYILTTLLVSMAIVLAAMMGLAVVLDLFFNMEEFLDDVGGGGAGRLLANVADYYGYKCFEFFQLLAAPWLLVSAAATFARFNRSRELTGIKAAGIGLYRVLWPILATGLAAGGLFVANQELVIPRLAARLVRSPDDLDGAGQFSVDFIRDEHNSILYAPLFDPERGEMLARTRALGDGEVRFLARIHIWLRDDRYQTTGILEAERAAWDPVRRGWRLEGGRRFVPQEAPPLLDRPPGPAEGQPCPFYATNVGPRLITRYRHRDFYKYLSYAELRDLARDPMRGDRRALRVALHRHVTDPILLVLVLLLGLPFVAGREEQSYLMSVGLAIVLELGVMIVTFAAAAFGNAGHLDPLLAAWVPTFVVLPASLLALETLRT